MTKKLGAFDAFMLLVCGILFADAIASNSSTGVASISWWIILGVLYMIPAGLVIGELSSVLPDEGGIYVWIYEGLGPKWAAMTSWFFFACGLFIPVSSFVMLSDVLFTLFYPEASLIVRVVVAIVLVWVLAWVSCKPMSEAKWVTNVAGLIKLGIFVLAFAAGIYWIAQGNAMANDMTFETLMPSFDQGLVYLPVILYCCTGMELASASAEQMHNPAKMLPKVVLGIAFLAIVLNVVSSWGMLAVVPLDSIDLNLGILDLFLVAFDSPVLYYVVGIAFLFAVFAQCLAWAVGGNRGTCESAKSGELPAFLGIEKNEQPMGAIITSCICGTILLVLYLFAANSASALFFSLLSCGVIASIVPYVFMFIAYQRLRARGFMDNKEGIFKAPFGVPLSWLCNIIQIFTLFLMVYIPGYGWNPDVITNVGGFIGMVVTGAIAIWWAGRKKVSSTPQLSDAGEAKLEAEAELAAAGAEGKE